MRFKSAYVWIFAILLLAACSKENTDYKETNGSISSALVLNTQQPLKSNDFTIHGIYHGSVLSASSAARGKVWVNIANDSQYNALVELVSGETYTFGLTPDLTAPSPSQTIYEFVGPAGSFVFDLSQADEPQLNGLEINGENFFSQVVKSMSFSMAAAETAVFMEKQNPAFSGTWSLIADGSLPDPNGNGGSGITSVMIVYDGVMYEDFTFDSFNALSCLGIGNYIPTINSYGTPGFVVCDYQTTEFAGGMTKWDLSYDQVNLVYMDYRSCNTKITGSFMWTSADETTIRIGDIILD